MEIKLTPTEKQLFDFLKSITDLPIRAAGGWVRDKLLGLQSHDIDIAVQGCSGIELATLASQNLQESHSVGVIQSNPNKSKHLETATTRIFDYSVDFVDLRCETYDECSRIPQVTPGSPEEDANRRDFCINALFYNIQDETIEDFTKQGLIDLQNKILNTPLDPYITFSQDPLRMIRALRFAARLNFNLSQRVSDSIQQDSLINRLSIVSRSRYQQELVKCFDTNLINGISILTSFQSLFHHIFISIFEDSTDEFLQLPDKQNWIQKVIEFTNNYYTSEEVLNQVLSESLQKANSQLQPSQLKIILGFLAIVNEIQLTMHVDCTKIEHLQNSNFKKKLVAQSASAIPLITCVQGIKVCTCVNQLQNLLLNNFKIYNLWEIEPEVLIAGYALNLIPNGKFFNRMDNLFNYYSIGYSILNFKPSIPNLKEIAIHLNITDKKLLGKLKQQILENWFQNKNYPNVGNWEQDFKFID